MKKELHFLKSMLQCTYVIHNVNPNKKIMEVNIMAFVITDACVSCGSCADQCPVEAISEGEGKYVIDADVCVSCGSCADQCPTEAIEEG